METTLKQDKSRIGIVSWYIYVSNDRKEIRGGIYHVVTRYARVNN